MRLCEFLLFLRQRVRLLSREIKSTAKFLKSHFQQRNWSKSSIWGKEIAVFTWLLGSFTKLNPREIFQNSGEIESRKFRDYFTSQNLISWNLISRNLIRFWYFWIGIFSFKRITPYFVTFLRKSKGILSGKNLNGPKSEITHSGSRSKHRLRAKS